MKMRFLYLIMALALGSAATFAAEEVRDPTKAEIAIVMELNTARQTPRAYAEYLRAFRRQIKDGDIVRGNVRIRTKEGVAAIDEAIAFLEKQRPMPPLSISRGLTLAARVHAEEQAKTGAVGHEGADGSFVADRVSRFGSWKKVIGENIAYGFDEPRDVVMQLIIDDGVPDRGHRKNLFNSKYRRIGIANATHPKYRHLSVHVLAGDFKK